MSNNIYNNANEKLKNFESYINDLANVDSLATSPKDTVSVDMNKFAEIAEVMRKLTETKSGGPGFFNNGSQSDVTDIQQRYARALQAYGEKTNASNIDRVIKSVTPNVKLPAVEERKAYLVN